MNSSKWFEVDLDTLRLGPAGLAEWPSGMTSTKTAMREECLESIVGLNLDLLFPDERLLLVSVESSLASEADVVAIDPLGSLRLLELKQQPVKASDLRDQVVSYGIREAHQSDDAWEASLARFLPHAPEGIQLGVEGFRHNVSTKSLGARSGFLDDEARNEWKKLTQIQKAGRLIQGMRQSRGEARGELGPANGVVREAFERLYGVGLGELDLRNPRLAADTILKSWGDGWHPRRKELEITVIAPGTASLLAETVGDLESRGVRFNLIDAQLRRSSEEGPTQRAVLRWQPVHRTIAADLRLPMLALFEVLYRRNPRVADFRWFSSVLHGTPSFRITWHGQGHVLLTVNPQESPLTAITAKDCLTEGLEVSGKSLIDALRREASALRERGVTVHGRGPHLEVRWDAAAIQPAAALAEAYYRMAEEAGIFEPFAWHARPDLPGAP